MNEELDVADILNALRDRIGVLAQENAILSARIKKLENGSCNGTCSNTKND
jgi:cell division protein FtsB